MKLFSLEISVLLVLVTIIIVFYTNARLVQSSESSTCINYDPSNMVITVKCKTASMRDINNQSK